MGAALQLEIAGAKGGESKPKSPVEAPDSLQSTNIAKMLIAVGEGEFEGTPTDRDIYLDNTPIVDSSGNVNFPGVKWEWRRGSVEQDYIQGIPAIESETTTNVELRSDNPFVRSLSNTQLSAVRVRFSWSRLAQQDSSGNTNGYRIEYAIDVATDGGSYAEAHRGAVDGKTTSGYQRSVRVDLPAATSGWMFRVRRLTPNANSGTIADTMTVAGYTEIIDQKLRYPNTALLYIEFDAQQFQNIPAVTVDCRARRWPVPANYDPETRTYTGIWDGTFKQAWTNNPVWATYGLCVEDRFGLGKRIQPWMVDKWEMYRIAQYCDQLVPNGVGGMEPRYLCDINLQGRTEAWTLLRDLSAIYRGMTYWAQGQLFMQADMPRAQDIDYVFTRANVIDGDFVYGGAERTTHYSRALVSYDNPANNYDTDVIPVTDLVLQRRYRDRPIEISAIGCTRASEAQRRGKWALISNNQDRTVTFKTGLEGANVLPGYVIPVADELVAGRPNGGRISAAAGRVVTLDRDTPIKAGDRLIVNLPNGTAQGRTVESVVGRAVTVTTAYALQPEPQLQWAIDYEDLAVQLFRVLKRTRTTEGQFEFTALEFNPSKFAAIDTGAKLDERPISVIPITTVPPPASVSLTSDYAVDQGIAVSTMTVSWPAVDGAVAYDVEWRKGSGNWIRLQRTGGTSVDVAGIYAGAYLVRVRAVSAFDITSIWRSSMLTELKGKEGLPPAVTSLTATPLIFGISLKWGIPPGAEDTQRTEIWYSQSNSLESATKLTDLAYPQSEHVMQGLGAGVAFFFWARLVDRTGNIGPWYPLESGVLGQSGSNAGPILELISGQITESELGQELLTEIEKISGDFPGSVTDRINDAKQELEDLITELTDPLEYVATDAYVMNDAVRSGRRLYMAITDVPAAADGSNAPPNPGYWVDIGSIAETANGLAQAVAKNTTDIESIDGVVTATAEMLQAVQSAYRDDDGEGALSDAWRGWDTLAKVSQESRTRTTQNDAMALRVTTVEASVADNSGRVRALEQTVVTNEQAAAWRLIDVSTKVGSNTSSIATLEKAVTDNESSTASRLQTVNSRVDTTNLALDSERADRADAVAGERAAREASISDEAATRADADQALGTRIGHMEASFTVPQGERDDDGEGELAGALKGWENTAKIADESRVRASAIDVQARRSETLEVSFNSALDKTNGEVLKTNASVQVTSQAVAALDNKASTMWAVKMQINAQGQFVAAGIGLGIENGPAGLQSQFLVQADRFAVVNGIDGVLASPFAVQGGQVFMNQAFIADGTITNAKIGSYISSTNYVAGQLGWILSKDGTFEINGAIAGQGRLLINNQRLRIFHANGNLAIDLGISV
ncbi:phage tail protein [Pseudomonas japonica]|uniref:Phage-related protein, tail component n=1 Tax=Pseudomonas japonica TaxID=256466 RepID=A0A239BSY7_9PSED|nr:phage tail protein [Pseudomonas japonica]SNS10762.1 Phage-related protein, tail component [Pseudomonas japonica]